MTTSIEPLDLTGDALILDPYPAYAALRADGGVHYCGRWSTWWVTTYDLCQAVFGNPAFDSVGQPLLRGLQAAVRDGAHSWSVPEVPPISEEYGRQRAEGRRTTGRALSTDFVDALWPRFAEECGELADQLVRAAQHRPVDVVREYAVPLATNLLADLMAVEASDRASYAAWVENAYGSASSDLGSAVRDVRRLFAERTVSRLKCPVDDFVGHLAANPGAMPGASSKTAAHLEFVLGTSLMISVITHQGLTLSFSTMMRALVDHPEQYAALRADRSLLANAVEEGLRYDSSTQALGRLAREDVTLGGASIPAGSLVVCVIGSANRDSTQWTDADRFDITRTARSSARHLTFGQGATSCLGASMSRKALTAMLSALVDRIGTLTSAGQPEPFGEFMTRGYTQLPIEARA